MPRVEVRSHQNQLVAQIRPRDLRDRVVAVEILVVKAGLDLDLELDLLLGLEQTHDPVVVLRGHHQRRHAGALARHPRAGTAETKNPGIAIAQADRGQRPLVGEN